MPKRVNWLPPRPLEPAAYPAAAAALSSPDILPLILLSLDDKSLSQSGQACRQWQQLAFTDEVWRARCTKRWPSVRAVLASKMGASRFYGQLASAQKRPLRSPPRDKAVDGLTFLVDIRERLGGPRGTQVLSQALMASDADTSGGDTFCFTRVKVKRSFVAHNEGPAASADFAAVFDAEAGVLRRPADMDEAHFPDEAERRFVDCVQRRRLRLSVSALRADGKVCALLVDGDLRGTEGGRERFWNDVPEERLYTCAFAPTRADGVVVVAADLKPIFAGGDRPKLRYWQLSLNLFDPEAGDRVYSDSEEQRSDDLDGFDESLDAPEATAMLHRLQWY